MTAAPAREIVYRAPADLRAYGRNARTHDEAQVAAIARSIQAFGFNNPILLKDDGQTIGAGHGRNSAALLILSDPATYGPLNTPDGQTVPTIALAGLTDAEWRAYVLADNRLAEQGSAWNLETLRLELGELSALDVDLSLTGFALDDLGELQGIDGLGASGQAGQARPNPGAGSLAERFGVPPFSVLNAREGWWQDRKRAWIALGIKSELGRGEGATYGEAGQITEPGLNFYRNREARAFGGALGGMTKDDLSDYRGQAPARAFNDGAVKGAGKGGLADQVAAASTARAAAKRQPKPGKGGGGGYIVGRGNVRAKDGYK